MIYLMSPYTHADPEVRGRRAEFAARAAADLMEKGYVVFSPIVHGHAVEPFLRARPPHAFWMKQCLAIMRRCERGVILRIDGWKESRGIGIERTAAKAIDLPIDFYDLPGAA